MVLTFADLVIVAALVVLGSLIAYFSLRRALRRIESELRQSTEDRVSILANAVSGLEKQVAELILAAPHISTARASAMAVLAEEAVSQHEKAEAVTPEILVVIAAAVTAFLGKKVRIRSAKVLQSPYEIVNPWSQQGRVFVQASHNLRSRG
jgi:methylmalonyl-CoA carboxyltransferase large subunit